ncbi:LamG domain-containing protein [Mesorhizobium sp. B1-1-8]|uniref:LamG domain-containing protein n=1 Tax=Mesorhizobium sp. B1-1-8 TaxID=2589976 RepID=UPI001126EB11|nr:LamG domain-containing protein [Mesorhizobium sp. B1-1-8]UCI08685.1 hypothetical protein FJ974_06340 [Mesorhizobium sp. B1-1-8]
MPAFLGGAVASQARTRLLPLMQRLGLTANLTVLLDAGDQASFSSGQTWVDLSGGGDSFFLGATSGSEASDPTLNGTAGRLSANEYWKFNGSQYFILNQANPAWVNNIHKAAAKFSSAGLYWFGAVNTANGIWGNNANAPGNLGARLTVTAAGALNFNVAKTGASFALDVSSTLSPTAGAWHFIGMSVDEAAGTGFIHMDGTNFSFTSTYATPSAASATYTIEIGARGNGDGKFSNTSRMGFHSMWEGRSLTSVEMAAIYAAMRLRFGI